MKRAAFVCLLLFALIARSAHAHRIDEYLQATILSLDATHAEASMRLIPGVLVAPSVIAAIDANRDGILSPGEQKAYAERVLNDLSITIDGASIPASLISITVPAPTELRAGLGEIHIVYRLDLPPTPSGGINRSLILTNRHLTRRSVYLMNAVVPEDRNLRITAQKRNELQTVYELDYEQSPPAHEVATQPTQNRRAWWNELQLSSLFHLGMRHIAEGTDHLLFLLVLLLPAPLLAAGARWNRPATVRHSLFHILGIVTAFTLGHSITLTLAAMGFVHVPERPIEVLIAVSILVSAIHALRPVFPGREAWIAAFFGLIHGLAFAATLDRLGLSHWQRVAGILAFNLGIETMQMLVVAAILPSLLLLSRTRAYPIVRIAGALLAGAASIGWIAERLFTLKTPVDTILDTILDALAHHAAGAAVILLLVSLACKYSPFRRSPKTPALASR